MAVLELERVGVRYGEVVAIDRGDVAIDRGEVAVGDANGAGKSTLSDVSGDRIVEALSGGEQQRPSWSGWSGSTLALIVRVFASRHRETA